MNDLPHRGQHGLHRFGELDPFKWVVRRGVVGRGWTEAICMPVSHTASAVILAVT